jgi:para-nitrobenzyl esterase
VLSFRGIPYAVAPRFGAPAPVLPWEGIRPALEVGPAAPQPPSRLEQVLGPMPLPQSEDCLSLNVWTPSTQGDLPVLVWFHGGGFSSGSGGQSWFDGHRLAALEGIVVVTVNYRLGALGYLSLPDDRNFGLQDQVAALRWVQDNIANFGGDPSAVTVAGQSAGAMSLLALMANPAGLFQRVILQSCPAGVRPQPADYAANITELFTNAMDGKERTASIDEVIARPEVALRRPSSWSPTRWLQLIRSPRSTRMWISLSVGPMTK